MFFIWNRTRFSRRFDWLQVYEVLQIFFVLSHKFLCLCLCLLLELLPLGGLDGDLLPLPRLLPQRLPHGQQPSQRWLRNWKFLKHFNWAGSGFDHHCSTTELPDKSSLNASCKDSNLEFFKSLQIMNQRYYVNYEQKIVFRWHRYG